jgi:4a-hydroxytetrahydrobiopterin dehydratase
MTDLLRQHCKPCEGGIPPLTAVEAQAMVKKLSGWALQGNEIVKTYEFKNYWETMAFVNASAWISHREDHHPDLLVTYKQCRATYSTHAIGGLSHNDFICAAKLDALFEL